MQLRIIDAIGPFFVGHKKKINWSKIPFDAFVTADRVNQEKLGLAVTRAKKFIKQAKAMGYNAIAVDDLAHLVEMPMYGKKLNAKISILTRHFNTCFAYAKKLGMAVYLNSDIMWSNDIIDRYCKENNYPKYNFLRDTVEQLFKTNPYVDGLIFRFGETDAADIKNDFRSSITITDTKTARCYLKTLLPVFEAYKKNLVFRTWTVGLGKIGDLQWNPRTFERVFRGIDSEYLIISQKSTSTDFFRTNLNPLLFSTKHKRIVEMQTRREYEGFGKYPSFVGWYHKDLYNHINTSKNIVGCMVWCQTGGWTEKSDLTFIDHSSLWNELNTYVTAQIFTNNTSVEAAVKKFCKKHKLPYEEFMEFLHLSEVVIQNILYIRAFSSKELFFRKVRVPPLLWVYWDNVVVNGFIRQLIRYVVKDFKSEIRNTQRGVNALQRMRELSRKIHYADFEYLYDTFMIFAQCKKNIFSRTSAFKEQELQMKINRYNKRYPHGYKFYVKYRTGIISRLFFAVAMRLFIRQKQAYRLIDRILYYTPLRYPFLYGLRLYSKRMPSFTQECGLGVDVLFK